MSSNLLILFFVFCLPIIPQSYLIILYLSLIIDDLRRWFTLNPTSTNAILIMRRSRAFPQAGAVQSREVVILKELSVKRQMWSFLNAAYEYSDISLCMLSDLFISQLDQKVVGENMCIDSRLTSKSNFLYSGNYETSTLIFGGRALLYGQKVLTSAFCRW